MLMHLKIRSLRTSRTWRSVGLERLELEGEVEIGGGREGESERERQRGK